MKQELIDRAIKKLQLAAKMSEQYYGKPLIIAYSGGKDSDVLLALARMSGIKYELINSHTTVDAPETVYHIREVFAVERARGGMATILYPTYKGGPTNMWKLIVYKNVPPTRIARYCCKVLKEQSTPNRIVALGVRREESIQRSSRNDFEIRGQTKFKSSRFTYEHSAEVYEEAQTRDEVWDCKLITAAKKNSDLMVNPIIEWKTTDIWDFIRENGIKYNPLYDRGYTRVGCVGCPMASKKEIAKEFSDYPKFKENYIRAFDRLIKKRKERGIACDWETGEDVFRWWTQDDTIKGQITIAEWLNGAKNE